MRLSVSGLPAETDSEKTLRPEAVEALTTRALERFAHILADVNLRFGDQNGPRGGVDTTCRVTASLRTGEVLRAKAMTEDVESSARHALQRMRRLLARRGDRRVATRTRGSLQET